MLLRQMQPFARGDEQPQTGGQFQQLRNPGSGNQHLFEIVEQQQFVAAHRLGHVGQLGGPGPHHRGDGRQHARLVVNSAQIDHDAGQQPGMVPAALAGLLDGPLEGMASQQRLAHPALAEQRHQPRPTRKAGHDLRQGVFTAQQRGQCSVAGFCPLDVCCFTVHPSVVSASVVSAVTIWFSTVRFAAAWFTDAVPCFSQPLIRSRALHQQAQRVCCLIRQRASLTGLGPGVGGKGAASGGQQQGQQPCLVPPRFGRSGQQVGALGAGQRQPRVAPQRRCPAQPQVAGPHPCTQPFTGDEHPLLQVLFAGQPHPVQEAPLVQRQHLRRLAPLGGPEQLGGVAGQEGLKAGTRGFERRRSRRFQAVKHHPQPSGGVGVARKEQLLYAAPLLRAFERQVRQQHQWPGLLTRRSLQMQPPSVCSMLYMILTGPSGWLGRGRQNRAQAALVQRRPDLPPQPRQVHAAVTLWQRAEMNQRLVVIPVCERAVIPPLVQRSSQQNQALHEMAFIALNTSPDAFPGFVGLPPLARSEQFSAAHEVGVQCRTGHDLSINPPPETDQTKLNTRPMPILALVTRP